MKTLFRITLALLVTLTWVGCDNNEEDPGTGDDPSAIYGTWLSAGDNVAPGFEAFGITEIEAIFNEDGSYVVNATTGVGPFQQTGTYTTSATSEGEIRSIRLEQSTPTQLVAEGIYEVDGTTMRYEVLDTSQGTPATPAGGFGSSIAGDADPGTWTQVYVRQQ